MNIKQIYNNSKIIPMTMLIVSKNVYEAFSEITGFEFFHPE
jgi:hypothetical protein